VTCGNKKAGFSIVLDKNPSSIFNQLSFCTLHTVYALLFTLLILLFCCQVTFCALVYFMWIFVLSQFPSHTGRKKSVDSTPRATHRGRDQAVGYAGEGFIVNILKTKIEDIGRANSVGMQMFVPMARRKSPI
jgi:hypothetical protein